MIQRKKKFDSKKLATSITATMATWKFIGIFLTLCALEIWWNVSSLISSALQFDKTMLVLNTLLSLMAAIQGSIIMIDQRQADSKRDAILQKILQLEKQNAKSKKEGKPDDSDKGL